MRIALVSLTAMMASSALVALMFCYALFVPTVPAPRPDIRLGAHLNQVGSLSDTQVILAAH